MDASQVKALEKWACSTWRMIYIQRFSVRRFLVLTKESLFLEAPLRYQRALKLNMTAKSSFINALHDYDLTLKMLMIQIYFVI